MPDRYTTSARVAPALVALSPLLVLAVALGVGSTPIAFGGAAVLAGLAFLASEAVRGAGQRLEPTLWKRWGGRPSEMKLSWGADTPRAALMRRRGEVEAATDVPLPSEEEERANPAKAASTYTEAVSRLRNLTRDHERFPLVFAENISYGFRRNLLGVKPFGLAACLITLAGSAAILIFREGDIDSRLAVVGLPAVVAITLLGTWTLLIRPDWVRPVAERYAEQLLGAAALVAGAD